MDPACVHASKIVMMASAPGPERVLSMVRPQGGLTGAPAADRRASRRSHRVDQGLRSQADPITKAADHVIVGSVQQSQRTGRHQISAEAILAARKRDLTDGFLGPTISCQEAFVNAHRSSGKELWVLLGFGVLGFAMRGYGFPLAPMVLGVVLGPIAELYLARCLSLSSDLSLFFVRPWALFFMILAAFSIVFPWYQRSRGKKFWASAFIPVLGMALAGPLAMMGGFVRPTLAAGLFLVGVFSLWRNLSAEKSDAQT